MLKSIKKAIWPITLASVLIALPFFIFGIVQSFGVTEVAGSANGGMDEENPQEEISQEEAGEIDDYHVLTLGDSLARGTGDEESLGFAGRTVEKLEQVLSVPISHENYAVDGLQISGMIEQLENEALQQEIQNSDMIMISIGGNDLRNLRGLTDNERMEVLKEAEDRYEKDLEEVIQGIREENPEVLVVFLGLYNLDYSDGNPDETEILLRWNSITYQRIEMEKGFVWIPTYDLFQFQLEETISQDQLHPNGSGYEKMANRIMEVLTPYFQ